MEQALENYDICTEMRCRACAAAGAGAETCHPPAQPPQRLGGLPGGGEQSLPQRCFPVKGPTCPYGLGDRAGGGPGEAALAFRVPWTEGSALMGAACRGQGWEPAGNGAGGGEGSAWLPGPCGGAAQQDEGNLPEADQHCSGPGLASGLWLSSCLTVLPPTPTHSSVSVTCPGLRVAVRPAERLQAQARCSSLLPPCLAGLLGREDSRGRWWVPASGQGLLDLCSLRTPSPGGWVAGVWLGGGLTVLASPVWSPCFGWVATVHLLLGTP